MAEEESNFSKQLREKSKTLIRESPCINILEKNIVCINGEKFIDTGGGFLLQENPNEKVTKEKNDLNIPFDDLPSCLECKKEFASSYLYQAFDYSVCDSCRDSADKHCLITRTEAKTEFLLKDCDLDQREPPLRFILRKNPHNTKWGQMKLYLLVQVEERALEVWGSMEKLSEEHNVRAEKRMAFKAKQYNRKLKSLRMATRSSLYNRIAGPSHQHEFGCEKYDKEMDNYSKECIHCGFIEVYEKM